MGAMATEITNLTIVYSTVYSGTDERKHQRTASLAFVLLINRWPVNSLHKSQVTRKMFPLDNVIISHIMHQNTRFQISIHPLCLVSIYMYSHFLRLNIGPAITWYFSLWNDVI